MNINQKLLALTANMPCKQINLPEAHHCPDRGFINIEKPYLQRFYAGTFRDNKDLWLHRFLSGDSDRHLHSHPFNFQSIILHGGYAEEKIDRVSKEKVITHYSAIDVNIDAFCRVVERMNHGIEEARPWAYHINETGRHIDVFDWHRIESVQPETWTALIVDADRLPFWFFVNDDGEFQQQPSSPRDWWKSFGKRGENVGDVL